MGFDDLFIEDAIKTNSDENNFFSHNILDTINGKLRQNCKTSGRTNNKIMKTLKRSINDMWVLSWHCLES